MLNKKRVPRWWMVVGLLLLGLGAGFTIAFRPLSAFWLQQRGGAVVVDLSRALPVESGGFACLAEPFEDDAALARLTLAIDQLEQASRLLSQQAHLYYLLGRAYCMVGRYDQAAQVLPKFTELRPKNPQADLELGLALEKLCPPHGVCDRMTTAEVWRRAGVQVEHLIANGEAARTKEDFAQAIKWYQRAERMGADLRSTLAFVRYQAALKDGRDQEAYAALQEAVETDAGWANADLRFLGWYRYGQYLFDIRKDYQVAEIVLKNTANLIDESSNLRPFLSEVYRMLGWIIAVRDRSKESIYYLEKSINFNPKNPWSYISYGKALYILDESTSRDSIDLYFQQAIDLSKDSTALWKSIFDFWNFIGDQQNANRVCGEARERGLRINCGERISP